MITRTISTTILLTAGLLVAMFAIAMARAEPTTVMQPGRNRVRNIPAPTPSPNTKRAKPIQSPRPKH